MKRYVASLVAGFLLFGCSAKSGLDVTPASSNKVVKEAFTEYLKAKKDKSLTKVASEQMYKASKIARVLSNTTDKQLQDHYAYLLKNQVKIARLTKKRLELIDDLNQVITKRNQAIEDAKHQNDMEDEDDESIIVEDKDSVKDKFFYAKGSDYEEFVVNGRYFDNDEVIFNRDLKSFIAYIVSYLQENPSKIVVLTSFTDGVGSDAYSIDMAVRRANRIKEELIDRDIDEDRVKVDAKGAVNFIASNDTEEGRRKNNRIIVKIK